RATSARAVFRQGQRCATGRNVRATAAAIAGVRDGERPMIEISGISKRFGSVEAVADVTLTAADGAVTGILGPNGAGKTTTLRMPATLIRPDSGSICVDGIDVSTQPSEARKRIGVVPHAGGLYPRLTAREHIRYFAELHGLPRAQADAEATR